MQDQLKIIIMNGPPQSGKDTVVETLRDQGYDFCHIKFAQPIRDAMCAGLGIRDDEVDDYKQQDPAFRPAMIDISENVFKKYYGPLFYANRAANWMMDYCQEDKVVVSDGGFGDEVEQFIKRMREWGVPSTPMIQIWQVRRPGHTFRNDSREWVRSKSAHNLRLDNGADLETYRSAIIANAEAFWGTV